MSDQVLLRGAAPWDSEGTSRHLAPVPAFEKIGHLLSPPGSPAEPWPEPEALAPRPGLVPACRGSYLSLKCWPLLPPWTLSSLGSPPPPPTPGHSRAPVTGPHLFSASWYLAVTPAFLEQTGLHFLAPPIPHPNDFPRFLWVTVTPCQLCRPALAASPFGPPGPSPVPSITPSPRPE